MDIQLRDNPLRRIADQEKAPQRTGEFYEFTTWPRNEMFNSTLVELMENMVYDGLEDIDMDIGTQNGCRNDLMLDEITQIMLTRIQS